METATQKIALVTGSSRGLGRETALSLARNGVDLIVTYRSKQDEADGVAASIAEMGRKSAALKLDTGDVKSFDAFAEEVRRVLGETFNATRFDFLVNNAGIGIHAPFAETTEAQFDELMNVHLKGVFFLTQKLLPLLNDGGRIVNVSSGLARFSLPGMSAYAAMKGGVEVLTRYLAKELGARNIAVNTVAPGAIATDFGGGMVRDNPQMNQMVASQTALGRAGVPGDIGPRPFGFCPRPALRVKHRRNRRTALWDRDGGIDTAESCRVGELAGWRPALRANVPAFRQSPRRRWDGRDRPWWLRSPSTSNQTADCGKRAQKTARCDRFRGRRDNKRPQYPTRSCPVRRRGLTIAPRPLRLAALVAPKAAFRQDQSLPLKGRSAPIDVVSSCSF